MGNWGSRYGPNEWGGSGTIDQCVDRFIAHGPGKNCRNVKVDELRPPGGGDFTTGFWSYRQPIAYWVPGAKRPTIALDCRRFSLQTDRHSARVESTANEKRIPIVCTGFSWPRTYGSERPGFLTSQERWAAGVSSSAILPRKARVAKAAERRAWDKYKATYAESDYEEYKRLMDIADPLVFGARERLGDREAIRYAIAEAHDDRMKRFPRGAQDWDPLTRKTVKR